MKTIYGKWLPDMSNGLDKMFIYCDQIQTSIVGDSKSQLLAIVPIKMEGKGSSALCTHTPPDVSRKLIKAKISELHISLYDTTNTLIPFFSGTVNVKCIVE